ncbi:MAG: ABC transporter permease protein [Candidatus Curtissbacteria bacterium GW2011_GWA1_40_47]|uniref:Transport permease protein n=1 Tax=Candidatus Curtissbacteria bacterium RIFOXYA1_FULL_41_14 TaxID=1797737 RepID=A0A1F5HB01_9BACT|nr:MAG: ABC transporter permease protein [Candidatus Curtissbacteria bacterium GW2011_GWB1_40_28]KKR62369.1 MAG: ABC transporter permease protein [Microgenomates group bacterium GW2011_GWC1_40_35]KKR66430.1 MAG: ABC transporter permease protein [Candidatus Curtissbacteria bacterium GW2011_GWA1_40_47]KKR77910.1 MAG: ABC transporter permease protein [Candidatus Curtissbacteria bacterium GW2011_GWD1_40_8]KKS02537.1 MAG: ABC transporter permease protein [Candidatus Curtissbacteria bacterium GW2011_
MINCFKELYKFRELLIALTKREIKVRYKQTTLGAAWAILQPFSLMLIFSLVFGVFLGLESQELPYPIFYYSALLTWLFFSTSISFGSQAVINNSNLVSKIYFPREVLPFASVGAAILDFAVAGLIFILMMLFYKLPFSPNLIFILPICAILIFFTLSVVLFTSALVVIWRDLKFVVPLIIQIWMFASPIIYPVSKVPQNLRFLYMLNPMAVIIENFRRVTLFAKPPVLSEILIAFFVSIILFFISYKFFKIKERSFADII